MVYHCLCDWQSLSLMPSPVLGFAAGQGESQARPPAPWAEPPWVPVAASPSLWGLSFERKTVLTAQPYAIYMDLPLPCRCL